MHSEPGQGPRTSAPAPRAADAIQKATRWLMRPSARACTVGGEGVSLECSSQAHAAGQSGFPVKFCQLVPQRALVRLVSWMSASNRRSRKMAQCWSWWSPTRSFASIIIASEISARNPAASDEDDDTTLHRLLSAWRVYVVRAVNLLDSDHATLSSCQFTKIEKTRLCSAATATARTGA